MRVISLLPAATEIVCALGHGEELVAVSHDCDYPDEVMTKPRITHCEIHGAGLSSGEVDAWVKQALSERGTLYTIDEELLRRLGPDLILTQQLCDVCAPTYGSVAQLAATLPSPPKVVNLEPSSLAGIFENVRTVASLLGAPERGEALVSDLEARVAEVRRRTRSSEPVRCVLLEWLEPLYCGGHWNPELVEIAGGVDPLGRPGEDSSRVTWQSVLESRPEALVLACCGNSVGQTLEELPQLQTRQGWSALPAVLNDRVYVLDGAAYFSRPGPRVVDSLELLAGILHPELFPGFRPENWPREQVLQLRQTAY
jgi:iron complex transport system substrate-binding protein